MAQTPQPATSQTHLSLNNLSRPRPSDRLQVPQRSPFAMFGANCVFPVSVPVRIQKLGPHIG